MNQTDSLHEMFELRQAFMKRLQQIKPGEYPEWPINVGDKKSQQHVRDMALRGVEEMFEALQHLKNWKPHRDTQNGEFNRDEFVEEMVDAFNYFLSVLVLVGVDASELFNAYKTKDNIIHSRLDNGY
tara:strand:+ start:10957 stop:11337 length:381 start_codon:yes stop_codon:yes gene_type:complete